MFAILKSQLSPNKQASQISHVIKKDDAQSLSQQLTSGNNHLSKQEARAYLNYIKTEDDFNNVGDKVEQSTKDVKDNHYRNLSVDANGNNILNISKDGKKYLFFDDYHFNVPQHSITLLPSNGGKITYEFNGDKRTISVEENKEKDLGTFSVGNFNLKATKEMDGKKFKGALIIDMSNEDSTVYESFKQKRFNVYVDGGYMLDNVKIYANGKEIGDESSSETYGPYDPDEEVVVHAEGSYEGHTLDTDKYTYKEPEKTDDCKWGFSFTDKNGNLAGSYTAYTDDGYVTEYDENGDEVGSGY